MRLLFAGLSSSIENFGPLTAVEQEKDGIVDKIPRVTVLLNQTFTAKALQFEIKQASFQIVHLATHGEFSSNSGGTFIRARDRRINVDELNRILQTTQVQTPIELLTLSACQTAEGDERAALGLAGVAVRAGARSTLASLWSIDDQSSAFLMIEFYRQLIDNPSLSKSQALRQAQLKLVTHPNYKHPSYWAPYVLLGNWL
jgi:CHAT domain-containing protein